MVIKFGTTVCLYGSCKSSDKKMVTNINYPCKVVQCWKHRLQSERHWVYQFFLSFLQTTHYSPIQVGGHRKCEWQKKWTDRWYRSHPYVSAYLWKVTQKQTGKNSALKPC